MKWFFDPLLYVVHLCRPGNAYLLVMHLLRWHKSLLCSLKRAPASTCLLNSRKLRNSELLFNEQMPAVRSAEFITGLRLNSIFRSSCPHCPKCWSKLVNTLTNLVLTVEYILYVICPQCSKCWSELVHTHLWLRLKTCQRAVRPRNQARRWPTGILWNSGIHSSTAPGSRSGNQLYISTRSNGWDILLVCYNLIYAGCGYSLFIVNLTKAKSFLNKFTYYTKL